ncbi:MAG: phage tail assembly chaperone [Desulfobacteraceae bacterium]|nr:phage tail assembly chaperone [Desulfobacteraceae bacterium]
MGYYAVVNSGTGKIEKLLFHGDGGEPSLDDDRLAVGITPELYAQSEDELVFLEGRVEKGPKPSDEGAEWENFRAMRNRLLQQTDWTQLPDVPEEIRLAYLPYRKALRDLPENTTDPASPAWPEAPIAK